MIVLAAAFIVIPVVIMIWVAFVGTLGLRFCWDMLFRYSQMEIAAAAETERTADE